jgi:hypothetical protein
MTDPAAGGNPPKTPARADVCAQCGKTLTEADRVMLADRAFCRSCYESLRREIEGAVTAMSSDVNYPAATLGAILGGAAGTLLWWGFTVVTKIGFGLVAVAIGVLVGLGTVRFSGNKRSSGLQMLSVIVALASYFVATYLVNMTFLNRAFAQRGNATHVPFPPVSPDSFVRVVSLNFGLMDLVFLGIVVYEAWRIPRPLRLRTQPLP